MVDAAAGDDRGDYGEAASANGDRDDDDDED